MDPSPNYDGSDEIEFFMSYLTWGLRGVETAMAIRRRRTRPSKIRRPGYSAFSSSATAVTDFFASPNSIVVPSA